MKKNKIFHADFRKLLSQIFAEITLILSVSVYPREKRKNANQYLKLLPPKNSRNSDVGGSSRSAI